MKKSLTLGLTVVMCIAAALVFVVLGFGNGPTTSRHVAATVSEPGEPGDLALAFVQTKTVTLTLLHNNDGESKLLPDAEAGFPGIARFTQSLQDLGTATDADILLRVTSGDNFLASKEFSVGLARTGKPLYDSIALSGLYEAMGFGNHDFDFGPDVTARFIEGFSPAIPFLAANIDVSAEPALQALADAGRIAGSAIFTDPTTGLDIGIVGALTPRLANISSPRKVVVDADVAGAVNAEVDALIAKGVTRIVLVSHLQGLSEDEALIPKLHGVDIVVAGGGDELLKNDGDTCLPEEPAVGPYPLLLNDADGFEVPVVTAPGGYRCIGRLDVTFDADGNITEYDGSSVGVPLDGPAERYAVDNIEAPLIAALAELEATVVGTSDVDLDGRRNSVRTGPSNLGELLADALLAAGQAAPDFGGPVPTVAVQNAGGIRNDAIIPAGDITAADTFDIAPFANFVVTTEVSRERFKELLEVGVAGLPAGEGSFPQIAGFSMSVDPAQPAREVDINGDCSLIGQAGSRVRDVALANGDVIVADGAIIAGPPLVVATIDFLANGGDCYPLSDLEFTVLGTSYQQALSAFITGTLDGRISSDDYPPGGSRITFSKAKGPVIADTADTAPPTADTAPAAADTEDTAPAAADTEDTEPAAADDLANTGIDTWLYLIIAVAVAIGGTLVAREAHLAGKISLGNRLAATRAWFPDRD